MLERYRLVDNEYQWVINKYTLVQHITNETEKLTAITNFTSLSQVQKYLDSSENIGKISKFALIFFKHTNFSLSIKIIIQHIYFLTDIIVLAVDMLPTKQIYSSKNGTQQIQEQIVMEKWYNFLLHDIITYIQLYIFFN